MYNFVARFIKNRTKNQKIELGIFIFIVLMYSLLSCYVSTIVGQSKVESQFEYPIVNFSDSASYATIGHNLFTKNIYSQSTEAPYEEEINWAPGYPLLVGFSLTYFGNAMPLAILQIILAGIAGVLIFRMARYFIPKKYALIPPVMFALDPAIAYYSGAVHTDGLFMALVTILVYALFFRRKSGINYVLYLGLGVLLGFATLLRNISQFLVVVLPVLLIVTAVLQQKFNKRLLVGVVCFVLGAVLVVTPWILRNKEVNDMYTLGNIGAKTMLLYHVKDFLTVQKGSIESEDFAHSDTAGKVEEEIFATLEEITKDKGGSPESHYQSLAIQYILSDPIAYTRFHMTGTLPYFLAGSYRHFYVSVLGTFKKHAELPYPKHENIAHQMTEVLYSGDVTAIWNAIKKLSFVLLDIGWRFVLIVSALLAFFIPGRDKKMFVLLLWLLVLYFAALTGPASLTRYRIVSEPFLLVLSGIGFWVTLEWVRTHIKIYKEKRVTKNEN